jgi:nucleoside phosphorylase
MSGSATLVTFAVAEEARPFQAQLGSARPVDVLLTGMGPGPAHQAVLPQLTSSCPTLVITSGFSGGLNPNLQRGDLVYDCSLAPNLDARLRDLGATPVRFHASSTVLLTPEAKNQARQATGADAVEMESGAIQNLCRQRQIPCAIVRVIFDTASERLPFDFNACMTSDGRVRPIPLLWECLLHPSRLASLLRLRHTTRIAAERLAAALIQIVLP